MKSPFCGEPLSGILPVLPIHYHTVVIILFGGIAPTSGMVPQRGTEIVSVAHSGAEQMSNQGLLEVRIQFH